MGSRINLCLTAADINVRDKYKTDVSIVIPTSWDQTPPYT